MIRKEKQEELNERMEKFGIHEKDLIEKFIIGSGKGGQKLQKTHSAVYLKHIPTGTEVKYQKSRLRESNRFFARRLLCEKIEKQILGEQSEKQQQIEKIRRQKRKRTKRAQEKVLEQKRQRGEIKKLREKPQNGDAQ